MSEYSSEDRHLIEENRAAIAAGRDLADEVETWKKQAVTRLMERTTLDPSQAAAHANLLWDQGVSKHGGKSTLAVKASPIGTVDDDVDALVIREKARMGFQEAKITVNGVELSSAQSMTIRVAVTSLHYAMSQKDALGSEDHGTQMATAYRIPAGEILQLLAKR